MARRGINYGDIAGNPVRVSDRGGLVTDIGVATGQVTLEVTTPGTPGITTTTTLNLQAITRTDTGDAVTLQGYAAEGGARGGDTSGNATTGTANTMWGPFGDRLTTNLTDDGNGNTNPLVRRGASTGPFVREGDEVWAQITDGRARANFTFLGVIAENTGSNGRRDRVRISFDGNDGNLNQLNGIPEFSSLWIAPPGQPATFDGSTTTGAGPATTDNIVYVAGGPQTIPGGTSITALIGNAPAQGRLSIDTTPNDSIS